ncbi:MAG: hypothetical protein IT200_15320 [Thermoleophilia bacterium]|nr:hypothetical protein [Thermoleophilia bacterium]
MRVVRRRRLWEWALVVIGWAAGFAALMGGAAVWFRPSADGVLVMAGGLAVLIAVMALVPDRVSDPPRRPGLSGLPAEFGGPRLLWGGATLALCVACVAMVLAGNRPWSPIADCSPREIAAGFGADACLVWVDHGRLLPAAERHGVLRVLQPGDANDVTQEVVRPRLTSYGLRYRPWMPVALAVLAALAAWRWRRRRTREAAGKAGDAHRP